MTDLDKAREWADRWAGKGQHIPTEAQAAVDIIQSLPDQWVDAEKVKAIIADMAHCLKMETTSDFSKGIDNATTSWRDALKALITPKLPTLADMDEDARHTMIGEDVNVEGWNNPSMLIAVHKDEGAVLGHNWINPWPFVEVRPLSELTPVDTAPDQQVNSSESPKSSLPRPEDVPANEPWLIEANGTKAIGTRYKGDAVLPWFVAALDGAFADDYHDNAVTLIHKLVPETHTLPEGMRLADHETLGRIVVSQRADEDGDYAFFESIPGGIAGASWGYVNESELTFLDGGN